MLDAAVDHVFEVMGKPGNLGNTVERKIEAKQKKLSYGQELQMQMQQQQAQKQAADNERRGVGQGRQDYGAPPMQLGPPMPYDAMPPPNLLGSFQGPAPSGSFGYPGSPSGPGPGQFGPPSPGGYGGYNPGMPPPFQPPPYQPPPEPTYQSPPPYQPPSYSSPPYQQPAFSPPPYQPPQQSPPPFQPPPYQPMPPPSYASNQMQPPPFQPPMFQRQDSFSSPNAAMPPPFQQMDYGQAFAPPMMGGFGGPSLPPAPGPATMQRYQQKAQKDIYRLELEQQMQANEARKKAEKAKIDAEDRRLEQQARGGGGYQQQQQQVDLNAPRGFQQARHQDFGPPGPMMPPQAFSPRRDEFHESFPPQQDGGGFGHMPGNPGGGGGYGNGGGNGFGGGGGMGNGGGGYGGDVGPPHGYGNGGGNGFNDGGGGGFGGGGGYGGGGGGGGGPLGAGPVGNMPQFKFRSDNVYQTVETMNEKARQKQEQKEALLAQIQEKKEREEYLKKKEKDEMESYERRFNEDVNVQKQQFDKEQNEAKGGKPKEEVLADALEKARNEAEEAKRQKFAAKRGGGGGGGGGGGNDGGGGGFNARHDEEFTSYAAHGQASPAMPPPPILDMPPFPQRSHSSAGAPSGVSHGVPSTPMIEAKVRQATEREISKVRHELAAEAADLRDMVANQAQQVAALRSHAERMTTEAAQAKQDMQRMRINAIRQSVEGPEAMSHIMNDYKLTSPAAAQHNGWMPNVGLDLPPPAAVQRRSGAPATHMDMGPLLPSAANPAAMAYSSNMNAVQQQSRPPTSGMRLVNPLEASLAAESILVYPHGREMRAGPPGGGLMPAPPSPMGQPLPFESIHMSKGTFTAASPTQESPVPLFGRRGDLAAAAGKPPAPATPLDMATLDKKNREKLAVLQGLQNLDANQSVEAIDDFLVRFSRTRSTFPERTATPVLRVNTPQPTFNGLTSGNRPLMTPSAPRPLIASPNGGIRPPVSRSATPMSSLGRDGRPVSTGIIPAPKPLTPLAAAAASRAQSANSATAAGRSQVFHVQHSPRVEDSLDVQMRSLKDQPGTPGGARAGEGAGSLPARPAAGPVPRTPMLASPYAGNRGINEFGAAGRPRVARSPLLVGAPATPSGAGGGAAMGAGNAVSRSPGAPGGAYGNSVDMAGSLNGESTLVAAR